MKRIIRYCCLLSIPILAGCGNKESKTTTEPASANTNTPSATAASGNSVVGEWEQQYTYFDTNNNNKLEPEEKKPSNTRLGFDWFRFNADGSCLRDKEVKFKSTYEVLEKGNSRELKIHNVHSYTITELTDKELILGAEGTFIVFKRIS